MPSHHWFITWTVSTCTINCYKLSFKACYCKTVKFIQDVLSSLWLHVFPPQCITEPAPSDDPRVIIQPKQINNFLCLVLINSHVICFNTNQSCVLPLVCIKISSSLFLQKRVKFVSTRYADYCNLFYICKLEIVILN